MAELRDLKRRLGSIDSTAQITKSMQMVSASKMQKAQDRAVRAIPYADGLFELTAKLKDSRDYKSLYLQKYEKFRELRS
jgi:F-type H+-transporting ATPase subunit gamma